jgi:hypothetical protein
LWLRVYIERQISNLKRKADESDGNCDSEELPGIPDPEKNQEIHRVAKICNFGDLKILSWISDKEESSTQDGKHYENSRMVQEQPEI